MTQKYLQKCVSISPSPLDIYDSIRSEFNQVPTFCEPLFGSATQVMSMTRQDVADKSNVLSNIAASNYLKSSDVKFGAIFLNEKYIANMERFIVAGSSPISFTSATVKKEENISSKYIYIGTMRVDINASHI